MLYIIGELAWGIGAPERYKIASFSSEEAAEDYLKNSRTKKGFSKKSLLFGYDDAWIDYEDEVNIPHDPVFPKKAKKK